MKIIQLKEELNSKEEDERDKQDRLALLRKQIADVGVLVDNVEKMISEEEATYEEMSDFVDSKRTELATILFNIGEKKKDIVRLESQIQARKQELFLLTAQNDGLSTLMVKLDEQVEKMRHGLGGT